MSDTDSARITELNNRVVSIGARVSPNPVGSPGLQQDLSDRALGMLGCNTEILGLRGTPTNR